MNTLNLIDGFVLDGLTLDLALIQGKTYQLVMTYPGNLTIGVIRGQIRKKYAEDAGELFATFLFSITTRTVIVETVPVLISDIVARIPATATALIPSTKYQGGLPATLTTRTAYVFDIEYEENGTVIELVRGLVQVKPETTV